MIRTTTDQQSAMRSQTGVDVDYSLWRHDDVPFRWVQIHVLLERGTPLFKGTLKVDAYGDRGVGSLPSEVVLHEAGRKIRDQAVETARLEAERQAKATQEEQKRLDKSMKERQSREARHTMDLALQLYNSSDRDKAAKWFRKVADRYPNSDQAVHAREFLKRMGLRR
ncbi:MAG: hypothetical protein N2C14_22950 [Planctomycetales bacterium]